MTFASALETRTCTARTRRVLLLTSALVAAMSCAGGSEVNGPPEPLPVASIQVAPGADTLLAVGRTRSYTATARAANGSVLADAPIRWRSSDTTVAVVDSASGVVTAVRNGLATITATSGTATGSGTVSVIQIVATVSVSPATVDLTVIGGTQVFTAQARDSANALINGTRFLWTSSNPGVATIDSTGTATVRAAGETIISASGRGVPAYARLAVNQIANQLTFTIEPTDIQAGNPFATALEVEVRDANGALVRDARVPVTLSLAVDPTAEASLKGTATVNSVAGIATFSGNGIERAAAGYRLRVTAAGMVPDTSVAFAVRPAAPVELLVTAPGDAPVGITDGPRSVFIEIVDRFRNRVDTTLLIALTTVNPPGTLGGDVRTGSRRRVVPGVFAIDSVRYSRTGTFALRTNARGTGFDPLVLTTTAAPVRATASFASISLGRRHSCGVATGGVLCWGDNIGRAYDAPGRARDSIPNLISTVWGSDTLQQVVALNDGVCGLATTGRAYCWGNTTIWPAGPVAGTGPNAAALTSISGAFDHMCGITATGAAYCWGAGSDGQLGDGTRTAFSSSAVQVNGSGAGNLIFRAIAASGRHTCAVTAAGRAYCWGFNGDGQIGDSTRTTQIVPKQVLGSGVGDRVFTDIRASDLLTCATNTSSQVLCWGVNLRSASGPDDLVPALTFTAASDFTVGGLHACVIASQRLSCIGNNEYGQVGPTAQLREVNAVVVPLNGRSAQRVWAGFESTCVQASDGIFCFGRNQSGTLGIGSTANELVRQPTRVVH